MFYRRFLIVILFLISLLFQSQVEAGCPDLISPLYFECAQEKVWMSLHSIIKIHISNYYLSPVWVYDLRVYEQDHSVSFYNVFAADDFRSCSETIEFWEVNGIKHLYFRSSFRFSLGKDFKQILVALESSKRSQICRQVPSIPKEIRMLAQPIKAIQIAIEKESGDPVKEIGDVYLDENGYVSTPWRRNEARLSNIDPNWSCPDCGVRSTCQRRRDPSRSLTLCNRCGLRAKKAKSRVNPKGNEPAPTHTPVPDSPFISLLPEEVDLGGLTPELESLINGDLAPASQ